MPYTPGTPVGSLVGPADSATISSLPGHIRDLIAFLQDPTVGLASPLFSVPVGSIMMWPTGTAPNGWVLLQGQTISIASGAQYQGIFNVFKNCAPNTGTEVWGTNIIVLPNPARRMIMGAGGTATGDLGNAVGNTNTTGVEAVTLAKGQIPAHVHGWSFTRSNNYSSSNGNNIEGAPGNDGTFTANTENATADGLKTSPDPIKTLPPALILNFIAKL